MATYGIPVEALHARQTLAQRYGAGAHLDLLTPAELRWVKQAQAWGLVTVAGRRFTIGRN